MRPRCPTPSRSVQSCVSESVRQRWPEGRGRSRGTHPVAEEIIEETDEAADEADETTDEAAAVEDAEEELRMRERSGCAPGEGKRGGEDARLGGVGGRGRIGGDRRRGRLDCRR